MSAPERRRVTDADLVQAARDTLTKIRKQASDAFDQAHDFALGVDAQYLTGFSMALQVAAAELEVALNPCPLCHDVPMPDDLDWADLCDDCAKRTLKESR